MGSLQIPFKIEFVAGKTARQIKMPVAKPYKLSSIPKTPTVEENCAKWSSDFHVVWHASLLAVGCSYSLKTDRMYLHSS